MPAGERLLLARHHRRGSFYWVLPGGEVEHDETPEEAAVREMREESGLTIAIERLLFIDGPRRAGNIVIRNPRHTFLGRVVAGELSAVIETERPERMHGQLAGVAWMPFQSQEYDASTRDTLRLVRRALQQEAGRSGAG